MATPKRSAAKKSTKSASGKSRSARAGLVFPIGRIGTQLRKGRYAKRVSASAATYLAATLEYLTAELLELSAKAVASSSKSKRLTPRAITLAVRTDEDLGSLLSNVTISRGGVVPNLHRALTKKTKAASGKKSSATPKL
jgi:histone H2A